MGLCVSKHRKVNSFSKFAMLNIFTSNVNSNEKLRRNDFYYFAEWLIKYKFYNKLNNNNENSTILITTQNDPNKYNIFKVIKAIDKIKGKNFKEYTLNNLNIASKSESTILKSQIDSKRSNSDISLYDLKLNINCLFDKLNVSKQKKLQKILIRGPPNNLRWLIWICIARNKYIEIDSKFEAGNSIIYNELLNLSLSNEKENKIREDIKNNLSKDKLFQNNNWSIPLFNLSKAYCLYDEDIKFNNEIINIFKNILIISDCNEEESFLFIRYLFSPFYGLSLRNFFLEDTSKLDLYCFLIMELIRQRLPNIDKTIKKLKINIENWIKLQLITLYEDIIDFSVTVRLWDCLISEGIHFILNFSLSFLKSEEERINNFKTKDDFLSFYRKINFKSAQNISEYREKLIKNALDFTISYSTIKKLEENYYIKKNIVALKNKNEKDKIKDNNIELNQISKIMRKNFNGISNLKKEGKNLNEEIPDLNISMNNDIDNDKKCTTIEKLDEIEDETIPIDE